MAWWNDKAMELQRQVRAAEDSAQHYDEDEVRQATVHTRQDVVLLVSYLDSANRQLSDIKKLLLPIMLLLGVIAYKLG